MEPLLPPWPKRSPGPKPAPDRLRLQSILYQDTAWQLPPPELGVDSGQTCWLRLDRWQKAGVFEQPHRILLAELHATDELDWTRACVRGGLSRPRDKRECRNLSSAGRPAEDRQQTPFDLRQARHLAPGHHNRRQHQ
ncbi:transposase [Streptomyces violascens]|uniref:transposase n=1 Tax=Streptomyces violascens TaxID=67381 RepID=UPI00167920A0